LEFTSSSTPAQLKQADGRIEKSKSKASSKPANDCRWTDGRAGCTAAGSSKPVARDRATTVYRGGQGGRRQAANGRGPADGRTTGRRRQTADRRTDGRQAGAAADRRQAADRARSRRAASGRLPSCAAAAVLGMRGAAATGYRLGDEVWRAGLNT
jgi:hypothetical protein